MQWSSLTTNIQAVGTGGYEGKKGNSDSVSVYCYDISCHLHVSKHVSIVGRLYSLDLPTVLQTK